MFEGGILYDPDMVTYGDWDRQSGYENTDILLEKGATAIFCMNDFMAGGTYDRLEELGLHAGKDVAVAGYDNREMACYETVSYTHLVFGFQIFGNIIRRIIHLANHLLYTLPGGITNAAFMIYNIGNSRN